MVINMSGESTSYNKYEVQSLLNIDFKSEFKLERIFKVYKQLGGKHFFYNILKKIEFPEQKARNTYLKYYTKPNDMWSLISYQFYNRVDLWWIIAMYNDVTDTFTPPPAGVLLKVPHPEYVRVVVSSIKEQI